MTPEAQAAIDNVKAQGSKISGSVLVSEHETPAGAAPWKHYLTYELPHATGKVQMVFDIDASGKVSRTTL